MRTSAAPVLVASLLSWLALLASGCLPAYNPGGDPQSGTAGGGASGIGGGGIGGGGGGGGGGGAAPASNDLGVQPVADLGSTPAGDLATAAGSDLGVVCDKAQSTAGLSSPSGQHNAGQECQGCHAPGGGAPTFYLGGTLYTTATGGAAVAGATINVTDAAGKSVKVISANNGNFWTKTPLTFPIKVNASLCPTTLPMNATVGGNGACNNCHNSTFRVHVP